MFDDSTPDFDETHFVKVIPPKMPKPHGKAVMTICFVDANHARFHVTQQSQTGILTFLQQASVIWYSKHQNTIKSSMFGSEFIAMKIAIDLCITNFE